MIIPELPSFLESMGGGEHKGLIIALFTLSAGLSRPFSGKLADKVGRIPVMVVGALVSGIAALLYPIVGGIFGFFLLRFFHGFSTGFKPTGTSAYIADLVSEERRGEAMGFIGFFSSLGMASGPAAGSFLAEYFSLNAMFYCSSVASILSVLILIGMKETLATPERVSAKHFAIKKHDIYEPNVLVPSILMVLSVYSFGAILTIIPDFSDYLHFSNRGMFFTFFTVASLMVRIIAGKASDRFGRVPVLRVGTTFLFLAMLALANTGENQIIFILSGFLFGFGMGICSPTIFAWTIDLSDEKHRGRAMASMYIALEAGIGLGAFCSGWIFNNDPSRLPLVFYIAGGLVLFGLVYLFLPNVSSKSFRPNRIP